MEPRKGQLLNSGQQLVADLSVRALNVSVNLVVVSLIVVVLIMSKGAGSG